MVRRKSIHIGGFKHANPIPNASRIGNLLMRASFSAATPDLGNAAADRGAVRHMSLT